MNYLIKKVEQAERFQGTGKKAQQRKLLSQIKKHEHKVKCARSQARLERPKIPKLNGSRTQIRRTNLDSYQALWKTCHDELQI